MQLLLAAVLAGCQTVTTFGPVPSHGPEGSSAPSPPSCDAAAAASALPEADASIGLGAEPVADGFESPLFVTHAGDRSGRRFVVEQGGRVRVVTPDGRVMDFLDISDRVLSGGERGLLGLAFSPDFATDNQLFVDYTTAPTGDTVVSRFTVGSGLVDPSTEELVLAIAQPAANHNGGWIGFGPDRMLYVATGDGGGHPENGQALDTLLGKVLRIDVLGERPYRVPADNPGLGSGARPEIWLYGLRNPWRMSFDRSTGDVFIGDVGASSQEELDVVPAGHGGLNLGWAVMEGTRCLESPGPGLTLPFFAFGRDVGTVVTGGYVYRGSRFPALEGQYLFADYPSGTIFVVAAADARRGWAPPRIALRTEFAISSFGEDESGELYVTDLRGGGVYLLVHRGT